LAILKPLSNMIVGEQGDIAQIDPRIESKLMTAGIVVGTHVLVVAKKPGSQFMSASVCIQIARRIFVISEVEASMILIQTQTREPIHPCDRPEIWRPMWPFYPYWRGIY